MADIGKYNRRLKRSGSDVGDVYKNNTIAFIEATFHAAPTFRVMEVIKYGEQIEEMDARVVEIERLGTLREVILRPRDSLEIGTYLRFDDDTWLVTDKYGGTGATSIKLLVIKTNRMIRWIDKDNVLKVFHCVASATDLGSKAKQSKNEIEWNKYDVRLPLGQLFVSVELNKDTQNIGLNHRFIFGRNVYEVTGIDDITAVSDDGSGIIQFTVKITTQRDNKDDFDKGIAFNSYTSEITEENEGGRLW